VCRNKDRMTLNTKVEEVENGHGINCQNYFLTPFGFPFTYGDVHMAFIWLRNCVYRVFVNFFCC
jgi:hypothetical protein